MKPSREAIAESVAALDAMGVKPLTPCPKCGVERHVLTFWDEGRGMRGCDVSECATCGEELRVSAYDLFAPPTYCVPKVGPTFPTAEEP